MPSNKTVAEKAKERAEETQDIVSATEQSIAPVGGSGIAGVEGMEPEDVNMPYMYLVRPRAKHAVLSDGKGAEEGTFYHSTKKTARKELEVMIAYAKKMTQEATKQDGSTYEETVWKTLMMGTDSIYAPFRFTFKGMNYWISWKDFMSLLVTENVKDIRSKVYKLTARVAKMGDRENLVVQIEILRDATEDEQTVANDLASRFSTRIEEPEVDIDAMIGELAE